jgi:predicted anti-sigma-YlaC factor YlaD
LAEHVASCAVCRDVVDVAQAMRADHEAAWQEASIPSSGQAWWRAEMRARHEAILQASRPIAIAQGAALLVATAVIGAISWLGWTWIRQEPSIFDLSKVSAQGLASPLALSLVIALFTLAVVTPVALYLVLSDE